MRLDRGLRRTAYGMCAALLVIACAAMGQSAATQPSATTKPTLYACILRGGQAFTGDAVAGLPVLQQVEPEWVDQKIAYAKRNNVGLFVDYEKPTPLRGIAQSRDLAQLTALDTYVREVGSLLRKARADAGISPSTQPTDDQPRRLVGIYTILPLGEGWQYGFDQAPFVADNRRIAIAEPFRGADMLCLGVYLHNDDVNGMTPPRTRDFVQKRIAAARLYGKPIMLFVCPVWVTSKPTREVPDELLRAIFEVARDEKLDVCIWTDAYPTSVESRRVAQRMRALFDAVMGG